MGILSGVMSYIFGLVLNVLDAAIEGFLKALGFDIDTFESYFPAAASYHEVIIGFAIGLLFMMLIFQIFKNFGVMMDMEAEDPLKILGKTALFFGMIVYSKSLTNYIIGFLVKPYAIFIETPDAPYEFKLTTIVTGMFNSAFANPFMSVVVMIMMLVLGWQFLKLCIEVVERYIVFWFVIYTAPVVFATGPFKSTSQIFKSWCRMLASQAMLLLLNVWCINLFLSYVPVFEQGGSDIGSIFFNFLIGYAFLKFSQKADTLLRILGLSTASTGDIMHSLGGTVAGIAHAIRGVGGGIGKGISALGGLFGKGAQAAAAAAGPAASAAANGGGSAVSGMAGVGGAAANAVGGALGNGFQSGGGSTRGGGAGRDSFGGRSGNGEGSQDATASGISAAKQRYTDDVLGSARDQLGASNTAQQQGLGESMADQSGEGVPEDNIRMDSPRNATGRPQEIDSETMEGLANLAHGMPHDTFDANSGKFTGGQFSEFTGRDANIIGSSQLTPADGVEQFQVDLGNGDVGTVYKDSATGDAHVVQFDSVDNGIMTGSISQIDPQTGAIGASSPFQAVHDSIPGAADFNNGSVPVADSEGGIYHVSTDSPTSFFAPGQSSSMQGGSSAAPAAGTADPGVSVPSPSMEGGGGQTRGSGAGRSTIGGGGSSRGTGGSRSTTGGFSESPKSTESFDTASGSTAETPPVDSGMGSPTSPGGGFVPSEGGGTRGGGVGRRSSSSPPSSSEAPPASPSINGNSAGGGFEGGGGSSRGTGAGRSTSFKGRSSSSDSSAINAGMSGASTSANEVSRFSRYNPDNVEVFQRDSSNVESYNKYTPDTVPLDLDD